MNLLNRHFFPINAKSINLFSGLLIGNMFFRGTFKQVEAFRITAAGFKVLLCDGLGCVTTISLFKDIGYLSMWEKCLGSLTPGDFTEVFFASRQSHLPWYGNHNSDIDRN